jgi:DNA-binding FadR family transcriptional regulator
MSTPTAPWCLQKPHAVANLASRLERRLSIEILRGEHAAGSYLPGVRPLATQLGTTVPTVQRVIAGLEAKGLVAVRHGRGVEVLDPEANGGLAVLPLWFEALSDQPARAVKVFADFLELRRVVAAHLLAAPQPTLAKHAPALAAAGLALQQAKTLGERVYADRAFTDAALVASGQFAARALFATAVRLVDEVPWVAESLYGDPAHHDATIARMAQLWLRPGRGPELAGQAQAVLAAWDEAAVQRFRVFLTPMRS